MGETYYIYILFGGGGTVSSEFGDYVHKSYADSQTVNNQLRFKSGQLMRLKLITKCISACADMRE